jgi:cytochrome c
MKSLIGYQKIMIVIVVLALVQFACSIGAQAPSSSPQPIPSVGAQATQPPTAASADRGTPDEAKAMLQKAVEHYKSAGRTQALADFNNRVVPFFDRDLYVACIDSTLHQSANGGFPNLVGSAVEPISRSAWDSATGNHISSIDYQWVNPATGKTEPKTFYYEKVGSDVCGVGAYHP